MYKVIAGSIDGINYEATHSSVEKCIREADYWLLRDEVSSETFYQGYITNQEGKVVAQATWAFGEDEPVWFCPILPY